MGDDLTERLHDNIVDVIVQDFYLLASEAPGILDGWTGPVEYLESGSWFSGVWRKGWSLDVVSHDDVDHGFPVVPANTVRLDFRLPEVRDRAVRWGREHDPRWSGYVAMRGTILWAKWDGKRDDPAALLAEVRAVAMAHAAAPITSSRVAGTVCLDPVTLEPCDPPTGPGVTVSFLDGEVDLTADLTSGSEGQHKATATPGKGA